MRRWIAASVLIVALVGCGSKYKVAPVSGRVTLNNKALANAWVSFQPIGSKENPNPGPGSVGKTDADGRFTLHIDPDHPGAVVGQHRVVIALEGSGAGKGDADADASGPRAKKGIHVPARYNDDSTLTCDVPAGGRTDANFDLKSP